MSLTFFAKSPAYSWKMSLAGHVLCQRMLIGPVWPRLTFGAAIVPAAAATPPTAMVFRKLRRPFASLLLLSAIRVSSSG